MKRYYWSGISNDERIKAISELTDIVGKFAIILNFQKTSDISLSLALEIEECKLSDLYFRIKRIMSVEGHETNLTDSHADCLVFLNITFTKGTGDLEIEAPDIPE